MRQWKEFEKRKVHVALSPWSDEEGEVKRGVYICAQPTEESRKVPLRVVMKPALCGTRTGIYTCY